MASGGIVVSGMEFMSYRVVEIELKTRSTIGMLFAEINSKSGWDFEIGFGDITLESDEEIYIVPLTAAMRLLQIDDGERRSKAEPYLSVQVTICGVFRFSGECTMNDELREKMIRQQAPAIVLPYLRATIGTMLVSAGFGGIAMPLVNIYEMAGKNKPVKIIRADESSGNDVNDR